MTKEKTYTIKQLIKMLEKLETNPKNTSVDSYNPEVVAVSKLAGVEIAATNYVEGSKQYFTYDEALGIEKKLESTDWRLPTRHEWGLIAEEFGQLDGRLNGTTLSDQLNLPKLGYTDAGNGMQIGRDGYYWSSTAYSSTTTAYNLYFSVSNVYPSAINDPDCGFSLRLVRDVERTDGE